ncbi:YggT family protein [Patescibacteria group bacterium]|nr:MAG: YggT family protein [Patescibacteria group bacterium]
MLAEFSLNFINLFVFIFNIVLLARVLMSWIDPNPKGGFGALLVDLTEPVLIPIRMILPKTQMIDFAPLVAFLLMQLLVQGANSLLG